MTSLLSRTCNPGCDSRLIPPVLCLVFQAQEEMAWKIAKMIVNEVIHQAHHDTPGKSTKVGGDITQPTEQCMETQYRMSGPSVSL